MSILTISINSANARINEESKYVISVKHVGDRLIVELDTEEDVWRTLRSHCNWLSVNYGDELASIMNKVSKGLEPLTYYTSDKAVDVTTVVLDGDIENKGWFDKEMQDLGITSSIPGDAIGGIDYLEQHPIFKFIKTEFEEFEMDNAVSV